MHCVKALMIFWCTIYASSLWLVVVLELVKSFQGRDKLEGAALCSALSRSNLLVTFRNNTGVWTASVGWFYLIMLTSS